MQEPIRISYYIDESGNTGDLAKYDALLGFGDQPYFSLAAIGIPNIAQIEEALPALKRKHKVRAQELKSAALSDKPGFIVDVVRLICDHDLPYFIEIVDKKFFLCMGILTFQLLRPFAGSPEGPTTAYVRNELAEFLYRNAPDEVFDAFVAACNTPGDASLRAEFQTLLNFSSCTHDETGRAEAIQKSVTLVLDEYDTELRHNSDACRSFLPPPDNSKRGRPIWLLPNLASLMNIYARINRHEGGKLSDVAMTMMSRSILTRSFSQTRRSRNRWGAGLRTCTRRTQISSFWSQLPYPSLNPAIHSACKLRIFWQAFVCAMRGAF